MKRKKIASIFTLKTSPKEGELKIMSMQNKKAFHKKLLSNFSV